MFISSIQAVLMMFLLMVLGFVLTHVNWINKETKPLLTNLTVTLAVPCAIFNNMLSAVNKDLLAIAGSRRPARLYPFICSVRCWPKCCA